VDAGSTPGRILARHPDDEPANLRVQPRPARRSREDGPVAPEGLPMPADDGVRLDDHEGLLPAVPRPTQRHPKQTLFALQSRKASHSRQHGDLLAKGDVFERQVRV
jgi:hypothetical protein